MKGQCALVITALLPGLGGAPALAISPSTEEAPARGVTYVMGTSVLQGFGCAFADLDGDGDPDVILVGAADGHVGIFENDGAGNFTDRAPASGLPALTHASAIAAADYDDDGRVDLYFTQAGASNVLAHNDGDFTFSDVSVTAGVNDEGLGKAATWGDFDGDGWLDLYVCNYTGTLPNRLYRNAGDGTFDEVGAAHGVNDPYAGFQSVWTDYDRDGDVDLYLSNDKGYVPSLGPNQLWRNDAGQLVNVSADTGADLAVDSMGVACGDFDGNRWPDLYMTNQPGAGGFNNPLMLSQDGTMFSESGATWGIDNPFSSWGSIFYDFDNDGRLDLYVNNRAAPNTLYINSGTPPCVEVGATANVTANAGGSYGSAVADVDGDGDLDLLVNNLGANVELFINHEGSLRHSIRYRVVGTARNSGAVGACVDTRFGSTWCMREILAGGNGYLGQNEMLVHVGAGDAFFADETVVTWPGGVPTRTITNLPTANTWTIYPPNRLGDADDDGDVDLDDYFAFTDCYGLPYEPGCELMDLDGDADVDMDDLDALLAIYDPPIIDCNDNGVADLVEITLDPGLDGDGDGALDACACPGDLDGDGSVDFGDLLVVIGNWGPCGGGGCTGDVDGDGVVGFGDVLEVIGAWGECG